MFPELGADVKHPNVLHIHKRKPTMGTNCAPLVADLFLFCYERDFLKDLSTDNQAEVIKAFNPTSRYLDDLLNIDNPYFEGMVNQIYPPELQLKCLTAKLLKQGYRYHKLRKAFSKFYRRHYELILKFNVGLKSLTSRPIGTTILW